LRVFFNFFFNDGADAIKNVVKRKMQSIVSFPERISVFSLSAKRCFLFVYMIAAIDAPLRPVFHDWLGSKWFTARKT
jgi:hypothetical protein